MLTNTISKYKMTSIPRHSLEAAGKYIIMTIIILLNNRIFGSPEIQGTSVDLSYIYN